MLRFRAFLEEFRSSLFFLPAVFVVVAVILAEVLVRVDARIHSGEVPELLRATAESARAVLSTIATAIITVAAVVFSVTVVSVQLASTQYSPRILRQFLRDRALQSAMGFMAATFTYCLLVLGSVRTPGEGGIEGVVPTLSVAVAVVLAVVSALVTLAFIDHSARLMQPAELVRRITAETLHLVRELPPAGGRDEAPPDAPTTPGHVVLVPRSAWVQQIDHERLLELLPPRGAVYLETRPGSFAIEGTPMATVWPAPDDAERFDGQVLRAVDFGTVRTMQQDIPFGIGQLVAIALRALSPAINDPTTAHEVVQYLGAILREAVGRDLPPAIEHGPDGRVLVRTRPLRHDVLVGRAFDQIRLAGAHQPAIALALLEMLGVVRRAAVDAGVPERAEALDRQARLVVASASQGDALPEDLERVVQRGREAGFDVSR